MFKAATTIDLATTGLAIWGIATMATSAGAAASFILISQLDHGDNGLMA